MARIYNETENNMIGDHVLHYRDTPFLPLPYILFPAIISFSRYSHAVAWFNQRIQAPCHFEVEKSVLQSAVFSKHSDYHRAGYFAQFVLHIKWFSFRK